MKNLSLIFSAVLMTAIMLSSFGGCASNEEGASNEVTIGKQVWMTKNLNVDKFRNGDPIPFARTNEEWKKANKNEEPAWCYYNDNSENSDPCGKLYNWYAVNDPRGLAPEGWRIPSDKDWSRLIDFLDDIDVYGAGMKMKSTDFDNGTNESGFSGLPCGERIYDGKFKNKGELCNWWSSEYDTTKKHVLVQTLYNNGSINALPTSKNCGYSVRCLKD